MKRLVRPKTRFLSRALADREKETERAIDWLAARCKEPPSSGASRTAHARHALSERPARRCLIRSSLDLQPAASSSSSWGEFERAAAGGQAQIIKKLSFGAAAFALCRVPLLASWLTGWLAGWLVRLPAT